MNTIQALSFYAIFGAILPPIIAIIQQPRFEKWQRVVLTVGVCLIAGLASAHDANKLTGQNLIVALAAILSSAWQTYQHFWKPTGIAPWIEEITTVLLDALMAAAKKKAGEK